jgi:hypothetical protein
MKLKTISGAETQDPLPRKEKCNNSYRKNKI